MKARNLAFAIAAFTVLAAISCTREAYPETTSGIEMTFTATIEDTATRTVLNADGSVLWNPADEISVFRMVGTAFGGDGSFEGGSKFVSQNDAQAITTFFTGDLDEGQIAPGPGEYYWAIYPYSTDNKCNGDEIRATLEAQQIAVSGSFGQKCHPLVARSSNRNLQFCAVAGGVMFTVSRSDIKSVSIKGNNGEYLAGKYSASFGSDGKPVIQAVASSAKTEVTLIAPDGGTFTPGENYVISLLPATLAKGITITLTTTGGETGRIVSGKSQTVKRSVLGVLGGIDSKVQWGAAASEAVDLGLSAKWASCNLGASKPEEYGDYFAWGEIKPKADYSWGTYKWSNDDLGKVTKYCTLNRGYSWQGSGSPDNMFLLNLEDDAANVALGGDWRIPSDIEMEELLDKCTWTWTNDYNGTGIKGYIVTSKQPGYTGNSIFLPAAGWRLYENLSDAGDKGRYWSSGNLDTGSSACALDITSTNAWPEDYSRCQGFSIRPVLKEYVPVTDISIDRTDLIMEVGEKIDLHVTVSPGNATDSRVFWSSNAANVVTVSWSSYTDGMAIAKGIGTGTLSVYASNGKRATCTVTVREPVQRPEMVDLGLSVKWASYNVGATKPEEYGDYFAWGETEPKTYFSVENYLWVNSNATLTKYNYDSDFGTVDNLVQLEFEDDAAYVKYGGQWRIPSRTEWAELHENCTWTWSNDYNGTGVKGYVVTGSTNKSIFLPAAGGIKYSNLNDVGVFGRYRSSTLDMDNPYQACGAAFSVVSVEVSSAYRHIGYPVRAVYGQ